MTIAWFTPFSRKSAIGRVSAAVVREIAQLARVELWHPETPEPRSSPVRTVSFSRSAEIDARVLKKYDLVVYNLGNHLPFHGEIYETARRVPGLCILHDLVMQHFFLSYFLERHKQPERYVQAMERHYGPEGRQAALEVLSGDLNAFLSSESVARFPLFEEAVANAFGVVTHSEWSRRRVLEACTVPVASLHLAYDVDVRQDLISRERLGIPPEKVLAVSIGHANPNRRILSVLRVIAEDAEVRERVIYVVAGPCAPGYGEQLREFVERHRLRSVVRLEGYVDDTDLASYLHHADFCVNLRWPALESGSASLAEEMLYGKPVIVSDTGVYSELPDDCVWKIAPAREQEELRTALRALVNSPARREVLGTQARKFAEAHFAPSRYAAGLMRFAWQVRNARPLLELADRLGEELQAMGVRPEMELVDSLAKTCAELFGNSTTD